MNDKLLFDIIKQNIKDYYCDNEASPLEILSTLRPDGSFNDLDYVTQNWTFWGPHRHVIRLKQLCTIFAAEKNKFYHSDKIAQAVHNGIKFFLEGQFHSDNWWMNDIGVPTECGIIRLMFKDYLSGYEDRELARIAAGNPKSPRVFSIDSNSDTKGLRPYASQGMHMISQLVDTHFQLVIDDAEPSVAMKKIRDCIEAINIEMRIVMYPASRSKTHNYSDEHCIKTDYSYHEHENELTQNSYGFGMIDYFAPLCLFWKGTDLRPDDVALREYINILLDGYDLMRFRCVSPMMTLGRDVANADRPKYFREDYNEQLIILCNGFLSWDIGYRTDEIKNLLERTLNPHTSKHYSRTKYFWQSDFLSHNRENWQFTVHAVSNRMKRPESILKKNVRGMFIGDGSYNIMQTGKEYDGIAPCMDWQKVPGTTVTCGDVDLNPECEIDTKIDTLRIFGGAKGTTSFVGGISDDKTGFFAYDYNHLNVKAKKAWFCFDEGIVCIGAGITSTDDKGAYTTLNQCILQGDVVVDGEKLKEGSHCLNNVRFVMADNIGYVFFKTEENVQLDNEIKNGCWKKIDLDSGTEDVVSEKVFLLGIDHGKHPVDAAYAYMIMPSTDENTVSLVSDNPFVEIVANTSDCQAVWHKESRQLQAVFYKAGDVNVNGFTLEVDKPCALMLTFEGDEYTLWMSNPEHEELCVEVKLNKSNVTFNLEGGYMLNNLGRPMGYNSKNEFLPYSGAQTENLGDNIYKRK